MTTTINTSKYQVELRDKNGSFKGYLTPWVSNVKWEWNRTGGCGRCSLTINKGYRDIVFDARDDIQIRIKSGATTKLVYRGFIANITPTLKINQDIQLDVRGYFDLLDKIVIHDAGDTKTYTNKEVSEIAIDIVGRFALGLDTIESMAGITEWADGDTGVGAASTQATFDSKSCMKLDSGNAAVGNYALRTQDLGTFGTRSVFSMKLYHDAIGSFANTDYFQFNASNGTTLFLAIFATDGLFIYDGAAWNEVGTNIVTQDAWHEWRFDVDWTAKTVDIYLDNILQAADVDCSHDTAGTNGLVYFYQYGYTNANRISYVDWFGYGLVEAVTPITLGTFDAGSFTIDTIDFLSTVKEALKTLSDLTGDIEYGVDEDLVFYWRTESSTINHKFFVGNNVSMLERRVNWDELINKYYLIGGEVAGVKYKRTAGNTDSQAQYYLAEQILNNSAITTNTVADQYLGALLTENSNPQYNIRAKIENTDIRIEDTIPLGLVVFYDANYDRDAVTDAIGDIIGEAADGGSNITIGLTGDGGSNVTIGGSYSSQVDRLSYSLSNTDGRLNIEIQLGDTVLETSAKIKKLEMALNSLQATG